MTGTSIRALPRYFRKKSGKPPPKKARPKAKTVAQVASGRAFKTEIKRHFLAFCLLLFGAIVCFIGLAAGFLALQLIDVAQTLRLQGRLQAVSQATPVKHDTGGIVKNIFVTDGEVVREGQILMSLGTDDLDSDHVKSRQTVSALLIRSACLKAKRDRQDRMHVSQELRQIVGRLEQAELFKNSVRICEHDLQQDALDRNRRAADLVSLKDRIRLLSRLSVISQTIQSNLVHLGNSLPKDQLADLRDMNDVKQALEYSLSVADAEDELRRLQDEHKRKDLQRKIQIEADIASVAEALIVAERDLTRLETLMRDRFLYASTSGRVQRLRIRDAGSRIAAGAYVLEIAPLQTDFEVLSTVTTRDLPDLSVGQFVEVRLSGSAKPIWVPARIQKISRMLENKRLVTIRLTREDLNKRDLLRGEFALNGLGEQSEAVISIRSETAWNSLRRILSAEIFQRDGQDV